MGKKIIEVKKTQAVCVFFLIITFVVSYSFSVFAANDLSDIEVMKLAVCDINGDNKISISDARLLLRASLSLQSLEPTEAAITSGVKLFGDLNADRRLSVTDARLLLRVVLSLYNIDEDLPILFEEHNTDPPDDIEKNLAKNTLLSPYENHGLGKSKMCQVIDDYVETMPPDAPDSKSHPEMSPLINGTLDYVSNTKTFDDKIYYILNSGRKIAWKSEKGSVIKKDDIIYANIIEDAYVMPQNTIKYMTSVVTEKSTDLYIRPDWVVPMNVSFAPISYSVGYDNRPWNLKNFTAEYMDIDFHYTKEASGILKFADESIISSGKWIKDSDNQSLTLRLYFREKGAFYGYDISLIEKGYIKISLKQESKSIQGKVVVLDAGHGGIDSGAAPVIDDKDAYEKWINLNIALEAERLLISRGATVILTRSDDTFLTLREREDIIRHYNADVFASIHCNGYINSSVHGAEVFYYYPFSMPFAQILQNHIVAAYKNEIYADKPEMKSVDRKIKFYPFYVTRVESCPSVLIETGYLTNPTEREALKNPENQKILALAIADGITEFLST